MVELPLHGGDLDWARRHFPRYIGAWLDLSTGVSPHSYPIPPLAARDWSHLPSRAAENDLIAAAADYYGVDAINILPTAGSQALIQILPALSGMAPRQVEILTPSFSEYARIWREAGFDVRLIDVFAAEIPPPAAPYRIVVSPNNPTGRCYDPAQLLAWAADCAAQGGFLWVDEAFADVAENSVAAYAGRQVGLLVSRSFGKFFGLAGLRLGFLCAAPDFIALAREKIGPWAVSGPALAVGSAAFRDRAWQVATRQKLRAESENMRKFLAEHGFRLIGHTDLFTLVAHDQAPEIFQTFGENGILLRCFAETIHAEARHWLRIGLTGNEEAFFAVAQRILE